MATKLIITPVGKLRTKIPPLLRSIKGKSCVYVSLNKPQRRTIQLLKQNRIKLDNIYFIDLAHEDDVEGVLHISPKRLDLLATALHSFVHFLEGKKVIVIDGLSTLLLYNKDKKVARFVKKITDYTSHYDLDVYALSHPTKEKDLIPQIYDFFDKVDGVKL